MTEVHASVPFVFVNGKLISYLFLMISYNLVTNLSLIFLSANA